jgi:very-short-patch-repair endonuclease
MKITVPQNSSFNNDDSSISGNKKQLEINGILLRSFPIINLPYNSNLKERAKKLRQARNLSEVLFWKEVTKGGFHNIDFDRQRIIGNFIVDFYAKQLGLVIEIDGSSHNNKVEYDADREDFLKSLNLRVYRIPVREIMQHMMNVILDLENFIIANYGV